MDSFAVTHEIPIDLKVKSCIQHSTNWYMINIEHMMLNIASENGSPVNLPHDKFFPGMVHPVRVMKDGLHYYDQNMTSWIRLEDNVQRHYCDFIADRELLGDQSKP